LEESQVRANSFKYANPLLDESRLIIKPLTLKIFIRQALSRVGMYSALPSWEQVSKLSKLELKAALQEKPHSLLRSVLVAILLAVSLISYFGPISFEPVLNLWNTYKLPDLYSATLEEVAIGLQKAILQVKISCALISHASPKSTIAYTLLSKQTNMHLQKQELLTIFENVQTQS
jgi:hypothetical protein